MADSVSEAGCPDPSKSDRVSLSDIAARIRSKYKNGMAYCFEIGDDLILAKHAEPHGGFQSWVRDQAGIEIKIGQIYLRIAETFQSRETREIVSHLPLTTLDFLCRKHPEIVILRQDLLKELGSHSKPTLQAVKERVQSLKTKIVQKKASARQIDQSPKADTSAGTLFKTDDNDAVDGAASWLLQQCITDPKKSLELIEKSDPRTLIEELKKRLLELMDDADNVSSGGITSTKPASLSQETGAPV